MTDASLVKKILKDTAEPLPKSTVQKASILVVLGLVGLALSFVAGDSSSGWAALTTAAVLVMGIAMVGPLMSAIFQITGTKWGRTYRRLAEGSIALMPVGIIALIVLMVGGNTYLPWVLEHPHHGGKAVWLTRGFWDARVLIGLIIAYGVGIRFVRWSIRRDFCLSEVKETYSGKLAAMFTQNIDDPEAEAKHCEVRLSMLAPVVAIVYGVVFSFLGFDLIMALEPDWFSTLFGAWYFIGNIFAGLAVLAVGGILISQKKGMDRYFTENGQSDIATLLLAFCLINVDFFWNQYLTIWYANLPEETFYLIERTADETQPWRGLSFLSLTAFFLIPFTALLLRKVKRHKGLLMTIAGIGVLGIIMARFIEIGPALLNMVPNQGMGQLAIPLVSAILIFTGLMGAGLLLYVRLFRQIPIFCINDPIFIHNLEAKESHP